MGKPASKPLLGVEERELDPESQDQDYRSGISWLLTGLEQLQLEQLSSSPLGLSSSSRLGLGVIRLVHTQETGL